MPRPKAKPVIQLGVRIAVDARDLLDRVAAKRRLSLTLVVEAMIREEHARLFKQKGPSHGSQTRQV